MCMPGGDEDALVKTLSVRGSGSKRGGSVVPPAQSPEVNRPGDFSDAEISPPRGPEGSTAPRGPEEDPASGGSSRPEEGGRGTSKNSTGTVSSTGTFVTVRSPPLSSPASSIGGEDGVRSSEGPAITGPATTGPTTATVPSAAAASRTNTSANPYFNQVRLEFQTKRSHNVVLHDSR